MNAECEDPPVVVMFRRERGPGDDILAVFPHEYEYDGRVGCYAHVGQHSACSMGYVLQKTQPAKPEEYAGLKRELEGAPYHYRLIVRKRRSFRR